MKKVMKYVIRRNDGKYLGSMIWTSDIDRAIHFNNKITAKTRAKGYITAKVIPLTNNL